jgi:hypothetical protein
MTQTEAVDFSGQNQLATLLITPRGVEHGYGLPVETQKDLRKTGRFVPAIRIGGRLYYRRELLERWLDKHTEQPAQQEPESVVEAGDAV